MALILDEIVVTNSTPVLILPSTALIARHIQLMGSGAYVGAANSNANGFHLFDYRTVGL